MHNRDAAKLISEGEISQLKLWIEDRRPDSAAVELDTNLIQEGILDSIEMINFILYVEELRGSEIPEAFVRPEYFYSLRTVYQTFLSETD